MAYVAVKGGREAIEQSLRLLKEFRECEEDLSVSSIKENMPLLIDKIMSEAGFYSEEYAALALKQSEGSVEEAVFIAAGVSFHPSEKLLFQSRRYGTNEADPKDMGSV